MSITPQRRDMDLLMMIVSLRALLRLLVPLATRRIVRRVDISNSRGGRS